ncbi:acyltransferase family protein [Bacteroides faecium]|uniref:Acyltransferase family protein n=1 Tax=Bacteroides faecium TaxID=2715212 RepID=A0A6H0KR68_9BACE|nr:acyltransferase family protein [Bacteroides faecium]QIU95521.1 acyltransferase family protein [Bacteroides faecium]
MDLKYTTALKGLAIFLIVMGHTIYFMNPSIQTGPIREIGVAIFLMLSGYGVNGTNI